MATQIIGSRPAVDRTHLIPADVMESGQYLEISEFYCDTIQGEGATIGVPAAFLRLQNCTLNCKWCDTKEVWRYGNPYSFSEIFQRMDAEDLPRKLSHGQHLVLTGGSPLMQQEALIKFFDVFESIYGFTPIIEVENECVVMPLGDLVRIVSVWNNSPKLENSRNGRSLRYKPEIITYMATLENSWFKFVVYNQLDWDEILSDFLRTILIDHKQVILMPRGETIDELLKNRELVVDLAIKNNVRYCTREHVVLWNTTTGV